MDSQQLSEELKSSSDKEKNRNSKRFSKLNPAPDLPPNTYGTATGIFECHICNKRLSWAKSLRRHLLQHIKSPKVKKPPKRIRATTSTESYTVLKGEGERQYECNFCKKRFGRVDQIKAHGFIHSGPPKGTSQAENETATVENYDADATVNLRNDIESTEELLQSAMELVPFPRHEEELVEEAQNLLFDTSQREELYTCWMCSDHFNTMTDLYWHMLRVHEQPLPVVKAVMKYGTGAAQNWNTILRTSGNRAVFTKQYELKTSASPSITKKVFPMFIPIPIIIPIQGSVECNVTNS